MRIVVVTPACPHPFGDTAARWFYVLVRELVRRGNQVSVLTATEEPPQRIADSRQALAAMSGRHTPDVCIRPLHISGLSVARKLRSFRRPFSEMLQADGFEALVRERLAGRYDVLHLEQLWTGWVGLGFARALLNVHHLEIIDREFDRPCSIREKKALWQMRRATKRILAGSSSVRVFSDRLASRARQINSGARYWTVPFALDLSHYRFLQPAQTPTIGLIGSMHWPPSRGAAERLITRIWPIIRSELPSARLLVGGWNADRYLAHHRDVAGLELRPNVAHAEDFFGDVGVMLYTPDRGSGMKIKVMSNGRVFAEIVLGTPQLRPPSYELLKTIALAA